MNSALEWLAMMAAPAAMTLAIASSAQTAEAEDKSSPPRVPQVVLAIHGGLGAPREEVTPELEKEIRAKLLEALEAGRAELAKSGATSLDAVEKAIRLMEDSPLFNAGKGAVFTHEGRNKLVAT